MTRSLSLLAVAWLLCPLTLCAAEQPPDAALIARGYQLLLTKPYLTPDFDDEVFAELWKTWDEPLRSQAERATPDERRQLAYRRYGLTPRAPDEPQAATRPRQYVDDGRGGWVMNCLACHGGQVEGRNVPGVPNTLYDLQSLTEDVRVTKLRLGKTLTHMDKGSFLYPLSRSIGTTNAVMFGTILLSYRDPDLTFQRDRQLPPLVHHDHDAPAWWHYHRKSRLYADGFAPKSHRALLQFLLIPKNGPDKFQAWEEDYRAIGAWIESLRPPRYSGKIDMALAEIGGKVFTQHCARCHGSYGATASYPEKIIPIDDVATDRARLDSLAGDGRKRWGTSWFAYFGERPTIDDPGGYVAPPLDGIWASAPYLHNGSVPTLWHLLHPDERPVVWQRTEQGYDHKRVGLEVTTFDTVPAEVVDARQKRRYFDTRLFGKRSTGHDYPALLDEAEKRAVLEYLKTL